MNYQTDGTKLPQIVSLSGGKDSTALLLMMLERHEPIAEVVFCDTTAEFDEMYRHLDQVEAYTGLKITRLKPPKDFYFYLTQHIRTKARSPIKAQLKGFGWPNPRGRWCTALFKRDAANAYLKAKYKNWCSCIGIAADEAERQNPDLLKQGRVRYPLIEWNVTEEQALNYCKSKGFTWGGLYSERKRVSCWCCPLQGIGDLYQLYRHHPDKWGRLKAWDKETYNSFRNDYKLRTLDIVFKHMQTEKVEKTK